MIRMPTKKKTKSLQDKEQLLMDKIKKAKAQLTKLQHKRKLEIATSAVKHGLDKLEHEKLDKAFAKLAKELGK